jgi:hypothetical protein
MKNFLKNYYTETGLELDVEDGEVQYYDSGTPKFVQKTKIMYDMLIADVIIIVLIVAIGYLVLAQNWEAL